MTNSGFLNCYELDEWYERMEDLAFNDNDDNSEEDDYDLRSSYYPETLP